MKSRIALLVAAIAFGTTAYAPAASTNAALTVSGMVNIVRDPSGAVVGVQIIARDGQTYEVAMNDNGQSLKKDRGRKIKATGNVSEKDGQSWLEITDFTAEEPDSFAPPRK